jgi:8-oxo-dGTP pyrophosphatase MutT (NUDIX family)
VIRKLSHETLGYQRLAQIGEVYRAFGPGDAVMTIDGLPGEITAVLDGPFPQTEEYEVALNGGAGGGRYTAGQLRALGSLTGLSALALAVDSDDEQTGSGDTSDDLNPYEATVGLHTADLDYAELHDILHERRPNENIRIFASRTAALNEPFDEESDPNEAMGETNADGAELNRLDRAEQQGSQHPAVEDIGQPDSCSYCGSPEFDEFTNTGRGTRARCAQCGATMTSWGGQWQPDPPNSPENAASRQGDPRATINDLGAVRGTLQADFAAQVMARYELLSTGDPALCAIAANPHADAVAALLGIQHTGDGQFRTFTPDEREQFFQTRQANLADPDLNFHMTASWRDVREKAKRIKDSGGVRILAANNSTVVGEVQGDTALYESSLNYVPGTKKIAYWGCGCKWASYSWGRSPAYRRFEGRQCFLPGTQVSLADGTRKPIEQIAPGDRVLTHDGVGTVHNLWENDYSGVIVGITRAGSPDVVWATEDHGVLANIAPRLYLNDLASTRTYRNRKVLNDKSQWKRTEAGHLQAGDWLMGTYTAETTTDLRDWSAASLHSDLQVQGDRVVFVSSPRALHQIGRTYNRGSVPLNLQSSAFATLLGWYLAEGSVADFDRNGIPKIIEWTLHADETEYADEIRASLRDLGCGEPRWYGPTKKIQKQTIKVSNTALALVLSHLAGVAAPIKRLDQKIMTTEVAFQQDLMIAYLKGDGWESKAGTASHALAKQLVTLGARTSSFIPRMSVQINNRGPQNRAPGNPFYSVETSGLFMQGRERLQDNYYATRISAVERRQYCGPVYNLNVDYQHTYAVDDLVVFNCSHVTALQYEAQSRGMFGRAIDHDEERLPGQYQRSPVTVEYDRSREKNLNRRSVPPGNMRRTFGSHLVTAALSFTHHGDPVDADQHGDLMNREGTQGRITAHDEDGNEVGEIHYALHPHHDQEGGLIRSEVTGGHGPHLFSALEDHLRERGLAQGIWSHDDEGHDQAHQMGLTPHYAMLTPLSPIQVFAMVMVESQDEPEAIFSMLAGYGVTGEPALSLVSQAAAVDTGDDDGGGVMPGDDIPRIQLRDQTEQKKKPGHELHHTNDSRMHAPDFGKDVPNFGHLVWCDQCAGSGCGHCGGTGQVVPALAPAAGPGVGDMSATTSPESDESQDAGSDITSGGFDNTGILRQADYTADSFLTGPPAQNYQAETPHSNSPNPGSTGWGTSADPVGWEAPIIGNDFSNFTYTGKAEGQPSFDPPTVSGVALKAADTGRVWMQQRSLEDENDPARGTWEMPGGHHEPGDLTSLHAGIREFEEETGHPFPEGGHLSHTWRSGPYLGHVVVVPSESALDMSKGRQTVNPDDPGGDHHEQGAWWDPDDAKKNPALRAELKKASPFDGIKKAAVFLTLDRAREVARQEELRTGKTFEQLLRERVAQQEAYFAILHDEPEPALPQTDGATDEDADLSAALAQPGENDTDPKGDIGSIPGGMMLSAQPDQPWGYSSPDPWAAPGTGGSADVDTPEDSNTMNAPFHNEASLIRDDMSDDEVIAAFQSTAAARALAAESDTGPQSDRAAAMAGATRAPKQGDYSDSQIAAAAQTVLQKAAMKDFSFAEQQELISEGANSGVRARNFGDLKIAGTHYEHLDTNSALIDDDQFLLA